ncbi:MAG TPA: DUF2703 domain-containing protein [Dehalococcoidia bacterium]|nr:DUF2703 domain-containing protein [Dehalococcoidia bacterium]
MNIVLMLTESCSHHDQAREVLQEAIAETGVDVEVEEIQVRTDEEAHNAKVIGSPTIRVDGLDVEHADREPPETSPNCRYYNSPSGWLPVPDKGMIVRAIEKAQSD